MGRISSEPTLDGGNPQHFMTIRGFRRFPTRELNRELFAPDPPEQPHDAPPIRR